MEEKTFKKLAEHLDQLPGGFSPSSTGADIRLLKRLFTPEEAELALHLTLDLEQAHVIAEKTNLPQEKTEKLLDIMAEKGLIYSVRPEEGAASYQAVPFVVGIYEFQVNRMDEVFLKDLEEFWSTSAPRE
jgi:electron transport complex protein RnfB